MCALRSLELSLWECGGIRSPDDLATILESLRPFGLAAGKGAWTATDHPHPVEDLSEDIAHPWVSERGKAAERSAGLIPPDKDAKWAWVLVHLERPQTRGNIYITRLGGTRWHILIAVQTFSHAVVSLTADEFIDEWAERLERLGDSLYSATRPALGVLTAAAQSEIVAEPPTVDQRRLVIGWRTWFGHAYVERYGHNWLSQLPDGTRPLPDGGIAHSLEAPLHDIVHARPDAYERMWAYLDQTDVAPAWPRRRKRRRSSSVGRDDDAESALMRAHITGLLERSYVLSTSERMKWLHVDWSELTGMARVAALDTVREKLQAEMNAHPEGEIHLEMSELPEDLRATLDNLAAAHGRLSYTIVPRLSSVTDISPSSDSTA